MNAVGTKYLQTNGVLTTRYFDGSKVYAESIVTPNGTIDTSTIPNRSELDVISSNVSALEQGLIQIEENVTNLQNTNTLQDTRITNLETNDTLQNNRLSSLESSVSTTKIPVGDIFTMNIDSFASLPNGEVRGRNLNMGAGNELVNSMVIGKVVVYQGPGAYNAPSFVDHISFTQRMYDFYIDFTSLSLLGNYTTMSKDVSIAIPDQINDRSTGATYFLRYLKCNTTALNLDQSQITNFDLLIRGHVKIDQNIFIDTFKAGASTLSANRLNLIFCQTPIIDASRPIKPKTVYIHNCFIKGVTNMTFNHFGLYVSNLYPLIPPDGGAFVFDTRLGLSAAMEKLVNNIYFQNYIIIPFGGYNGTTPTRWIGDYTKYCEGNVTSLNYSDTTNIFCAFLLGLSKN